MSPTTVTECSGSHQLPLLTGSAWRLPGPGDAGLCPVCGQRVSVSYGGFVSTHPPRREQAG
jgi:hypothetical protein